MAQFKSEFKPVDRAILDQATWTFRRSERVRSALHFLKDNPQEFKVRTEQFDAIVRRLNKMIQTGAIDDHNFEHVKLLSEQLQGKKNNR